MTAPGERAVPEHLEELLPEAAIRAETARVARDVSAWGTGVLSGTGRQALAVCVLRGGVFFYSDLLQRLTVTVEPAFCRCRSYAAGENGRQRREVEIDMYDLELAGRSVLLVDNICDSGRTLKVMTERCVREGVAEVRSVTLVRRVRDDALCQPDWHVFEVSDPAWLAGYGLRDRDALMNYPTVYRVLR